MNGTTPTYEKSEENMVVEVKEEYRWLHVSSFRLKRGFRPRPGDRDGTYKKQ